MENREPPILPRFMISGVGRFLFPVSMELCSAFQVFCWCNVIKSKLLSENNYKYLPILNSSFLIIAYLTCLSLLYLMNYISNRHIIYDPLLEF